MEPARRIEVHPGRVVVVRKDGGHVEYRLVDVRRLVTCRGSGGELFHALVVRGGLTYKAPELQFKGVAWVERPEPETGCTAYESPGFEVASKLLLEASKKIREALDLLSSPEVQTLAEFYNQYKGCSPEYTWVKNPAGKKYWYWYIKCPDKTIKSIYMGKTIGPYNIKLEAARAVAEATKHLETLEAIAGELEQAARKLTLGELAEAKPEARAEPQSS